MRCREASLLGKTGKMGVSFAPLKFANAFDVIRLFTHLGPSNGVPLGELREFADGFAELCGGVGCDQDDRVVVGRLVHLLDPDMAKRGDVDDGFGLFDQSHGVLCVNAPANRRPVKLGAGPRRCARGKPTDVGWQGTSFLMFCFGVSLPVGLLRRAADSRWRVGVQLEIFGEIVNARVLRELGQKQAPGALRAVWDRS